MLEDNRNIELFETYQQGDLSEKEVKEFDARLAYDEEFNKAYQSYINVEQKIKAHFTEEELLSKFKKIDTDLDLNPKKNKKSLYLTLSIAATLLLLVTIPLFTSNDSFPIEDYWNYEAGLPVKMNEGNRYDQAMNAYKLEKWEEAKVEFSNIDSDTSNFYLGIVYYNQHKKEQSIKSFKAISSNSIWYENAQYRIGLIYLYKGNKKKAKTTFSNLVIRFPNTIFKKSISELQQK